jgi:hypothetical protein
VTRAARGEAAAQPGRRPPAAVRDPVILVLLLIAFFSAISGKPLDGVLMLLVAAGLAWDARTRSRRLLPAGSADGLPAGPVDGRPAAPADDAPHSAPAPDGVAAPRRGIRLLAGVAAVAAGVSYAIIVGSFSRFSWPATAAVVSVGALVVLAGWQPSRRPRPDGGPLPRTGVLLWGGVLVAGGLWELWSLFQQPAMDTTSYAHPTISALTDPVLAAQPGRALVLGGWLLLGWYLVRR